MDFSGSNIPFLFNVQSPLALALSLCCERAFEEEQIEWYSNISIIKDLHTLINYKGPSVSPL